MSSVISSFTKKRCKDTKVLRGGQIIMQKNTAIAVFFRIFASRFELILLFNIKYKAL
jgi:hypothetical protein